MVLGFVVFRNKSSMNKSDNCLESNFNLVILSSMCDTTLLKELTTNKNPFL